jgi:hypothetical protein
MRNADDNVTKQRIFYTGDASFISIYLVQNIETVKYTNRLGRNLYEKLIIAQIAKKLSTFYVTRRFITLFTKARDCSLY